MTGSADDDGHASASVDGDGNDDKVNDDASDGETNDDASDDDTNDPAVPEEVETLLEELAELEELDAVAESPEARKQVRETIAVAREVREQSRLRRVVTGFDRSDAAESLLGSVLLGIPMAVEGGTSEVATFLSVHPFLLAGTLLATLVVVAGVLFVADIRDVRIEDPLAGFIPRRFLGVVSVSFLTAVLLLTAWGRVSWAEPGLALASVAVAFVPMSLGAALGDLLPEET
jgi:uncharacterized membrane protein